MAQTKSPDDMMLDTGTKTILIVEDEEMVRDIAVKALTSFGYKTLIAENGEKAVQLFANAYKSIDAVLPDIIIPKMSGTETFRQMLEIDPQVRVLIATGHITNQDQKKIFTKAKAYLEKPYQIMELKKAIESILK